MVNKKLIVLCAALMVPTVLNATIGCMEKGHNLKKQYDYKEYHFVECNCPCIRHMRKNKCPECQHILVPPKLVFITGSTPHNISTGTGYQCVEPGKAVQALINKYKRGK